MNLKFTITTKIKKAETIEKAKLVLFDCMVKMHELATINCPVDTGRLKISINLFPWVPGALSYVLADGVTYGSDVEFGTSPHTIRPVSKKALKFKADNKTIFARKVEHPGTEAQPFFRPALDQVKKVWVDRFFNREF